MAANSLRNLDQQRAIYAQNCIEAVKARPQKEKDKLLGLVQNLPVRTRHHGLGQTMAFLCAKVERNESGTIKGGDPHSVVYGWLSSWLSSKDTDKHPCAVYGGGDLLDAILLCNLVQLRRATAEAIALAGWLKLLGEARLVAASPPGEGRG